MHLSANGQTAARHIASCQLFFFSLHQLKKKKQYNCLFSTIQRHRGDCCSWAVNFPGRLTELHRATCSGREGTQEVPARRQRLIRFFFSSFFSCHNFADAALPAMLGQVTKTASLETLSSRNNFKVSLRQSVLRQDCNIYQTKVAV